MRHDAELRQRYASLISTDPLAGLQNAGQRDPRCEDCKLVSLFCMACDSMGWSTILMAPDTPTLASSFPPRTHAFGTTGDTFRPPGKPSPRGFVRGPKAARGEIGGLPYVSVPMGYDARRKGREEDDYMDGSRNSGTVRVGDARGRVIRGAGVRAEDREGDERARTGLKRLLNSP
jgi:hypothetical protein